MTDFRGDYGTRPFGYLRWPTGLTVRPEMAARWCVLRRSWPDARCTKDLGHLHRWQCRWGARGKSSRRCHEVTVRIFDPNAYIVVISTANNVVV